VHSKAWAVGRTQQSAADDTIAWPPGVTGSRECTLTAACVWYMFGKTIFINRCCMGERGGCFQWCLFVCLFVCQFIWQQVFVCVCVVCLLFINTISSERLNVGWRNLAVRCSVQKSRPHPWNPTPQNVAVCWVTTQKINKRLWAWQAWQWATPPYPSVNK